jgi:hypothetical protein
VPVEEAEEWRLLVLLAVGSENGEEGRREEDAS